MPPSLVVLQALAVIPHEIMEIDPALADTAAFCAAYGIPLEHSANAILVASRKPEGHRAVCLVLATTRLDVNGLVRRRLGVRKVSFASAEETMAVTGMEIGGVTVFGLPAELPIWIDGAVLERDWIIVGAGSRSAKVRIAPKELTRLANVEVVPDLALAVAANEESVSDEPDQRE